MRRENLGNPENNPRTMTFNNFLMTTASFEKRKFDIENKMRQLTRQRDTGQQSIPIDQQPMYQHKRTHNDRFDSI